MLSVVEGIAQKKIILLFYKEFEKDKYVKFDRYLKRLLRPLYNRTHHRQKKTGFAVSFELLQEALSGHGYQVLVNNHAVARKYPEYPVGLVGFPQVLDGWSLPNPVILGPSLYDHPMLAPDLMDDPRFKTYLVLAEWMYNMFRPTYGAKCIRWYAGIDTEQWGDTGECSKDVDFLIYDKIRWDHDRFESELIRPIQERLKGRGFRSNIIRYKYHDHETYRELLQRSRAMVFLCEHETQGLAYQEALASNVPVLAWDNGFWLDPLWKRVSSSMIPASSVPFFSPECGDRFADLTRFDSALGRFISNMEQFNPRKYVIENLSMNGSAEIYAREYFSLLP
jgi:hypothetical protein